MRKFYDGYASPAPLRVRYFLDWACGNCGSAHVDVDPEDCRKLSWCDGGPSTEDEMRYWLCNDCGAKSLGYDMKTRRENHELTAAEEQRERVQQRLELEQLRLLLAGLEESEPKSDT